MNPPRQLPDQPFDAHQQAIAEWMGCTVDAMNRDHDDLHRALCNWLRIKSHSMADASGRAFDPVLSGMEEVAVLYVQRLMANHGVGVPQ